MSKIVRLSYDGCLRKSGRVKKQRETAGVIRGLRPEGSRATKVGMKHTSNNTPKVPAISPEPIMLHVGLDVHKDTIAVATAPEGGAVAAFLKTISHDLHCHTRRAR